MTVKRFKALAVMLGACIFIGCGNVSADNADPNVESGTEEVEDSEAYERFEESVSADEPEIQDFLPRKGMSHPTERTESALMAMYGAISPVRWYRRRSGTGDPLP